MKKIFAVVLAAGIVAACNSPKGANAQGDNDSTAVAQPAKVDVKSLLPSKAEVDSVSYLIGVKVSKISSRRKAISVIRNSASSSRLIPTR